MSEMTLEQAIEYFDSEPMHHDDAMAWQVIKAQLTRAPGQVTDEYVERALKVFNTSRNYDGNVAGIAMRDALESARLAQPVDEGKQQWDELAAILGAHGDNVDEVFRKAREAMVQPVAAKMSDAVANLTTSQKTPSAEDRALITENLDFLLSEPHPQAAQGDGSVCFTDNGDDIEQRMSEHAENACPYCGGSGHKDDVQGGEAQGEAVRYRCHQFGYMVPDENGPWIKYAERAAVPEGWVPTNAEVRTWMERNDLDNQHLSQMRIAIDDARSMHLLSAAPTLAGKEKG